MDIAEVRKLTSGDPLVIAEPFPPYTTKPRAIVEFSELSGSTVYVFIINSEGQRVHHLSMQASKLEPCTREDTAAALEDKQKSYEMKKIEMDQMLNTLKEAIDRLRKFKTNEEDIEDACKQISSLESVAAAYPSSLRYIRERMGII